MARLFDIARRRYRKIVLPEGEDARIVAAALRLQNEKIAQPILLGVPEEIASVARGIGGSPDGIVVIDPRHDARLKSYGETCAAVRPSMTPAMAARLVAKPLYFGGMIRRNPGQTTRITKAR